MQKSNHERNRVSNQSQNLTNIYQDESCKDSSDENNFQSNEWLGHNLEQSQNSEPFYSELYRDSRRYLNSEEKIDNDVSSYYIIINDITSNLVPQFRNLREKSFSFKLSSFLPESNN